MATKSRRRRTVEAGAQSCQSWRNVHSITFLVLAGSRTDAGGERQAQDTDGEVPLGPLIFLPLCRIRHRGNHAGRGYAGLAALAGCCRWSAG